jgi:isocitrate dehydrogenase
MDGIGDLVDFAYHLEHACFDTLADGIVTKDLVNLMEGVTPKAVNSAGFIGAIRERLEKNYK